VTPTATGSWFRNCPGLTSKEGAPVVKEDSSIIIKIPLNLWLLAVALTVLVVVLAFALGWTLGR
jgi:hypothetical protein